MFEVKADTNWRQLYQIGAAAALLQLICIILAVTLSATVGAAPSTAQEYFDVYAASRWTGLLRSDFCYLFLVALYLVTFPALFMALRRVNATLSLLATLFTLVAACICLSTQAGYSMMYLSERYAAAINETQRMQLLAAGQAILAGDMWNGSGAYMAGILLQGGGIIMSLVMRGSRNFSRVTAYCGLLGNAFDLLQHVLHPFLPAVSGVVIMFMGPFYLVWFPMLARDLIRLSRKSSDA
ncbi:MAG: DUF4386 domain-containing protein [Anaerolineae bacterium]|nr:DUF4386 domain-containing protein [Anaerolineae bacterium]